MSKEKDPAFLFYSKDWLEGTMEMSAQEKGVYIDLLAHQHQKGSLPSEPKKLAKLAGMSEAEFAPLWEEISSKFIANANGRLVNRKLDGIVANRMDKAWRLAIVGTLGATVRYGISQEGKSPEIAEKVKKTFKVDDFLACSKENLSESISRWFSISYNKCYDLLANANVNGNKGKEEKGVRGEGKEGGWNQMPGPESMHLEIPEIKAGSAMELMHFAGNKATLEQVYKLWGIFKVQYFTGKKFYQSEDETYRHFINWSKTQKINGTDGKASVGSVAKPGTSEARINTAKNW